MKHAECSRPHPGKSAWELWWGFVCRRLDIGFDAILTSGARVLQDHRILLSIHLIIIRYRNTGQEKTVDMDWLTLFYCYWWCYVVNIWFVGIRWLWYQQHLQCSLYTLACEYWPYKQVDLYMYMSLRTPHLGTQGVCEWSCSDHSVLCKSDWWQCDNRQMSLSNSGYIFCQFSTELFSVILPPCCLLESSQLGANDQSCMTWAFPGIPHGMSIVNTSDQGWIN